MHYLLFGLGAARQNPAAAAGYSLVLAVVRSGIEIRFPRGLEQKSLHCRSRNLRCMQARPNQRQGRWEAVRSVPLGLSRSASGAGCFLLFNMAASDPSPAARGQVGLEMFAAAFSDTLTARLSLESASGLDSQPGLGGCGVVDEVGERLGTNSPALYCKLRTLTGNLQSPSFTTLLGQFP